MDDLVKRHLPAALLLFAACARSASAAPGDDQYAVAAGHYAQSRWELAVAEFESFLDFYPEHSRHDTATFYLGEALVQLGRYADARGHFQQVLLHDPEHPLARQALFRSGESAYFAGQLEQALDDLRQFHQRYSTDAINAYALPYLGEVLLRTGDPAAARQRFEEALHNFPEGPLRHDCQLGMAKSALTLGDDETAQPLLRQLAASPDSPLADDAQFELAAAHYEQGDYHAAAKEFDRLLGEFSDSTLVQRATLASGWAWYQSKAYGRAGERFGALVDDDELAMQARLWLGLTQRAKAQPKQATETFLAAAARQPDHELVATLHYYVGDTLLRSDEASQAIEWFDRVLAERPESEWSDDSLLGKLHAALFLEDHERIEQSAADFERRFPDSPLMPAALRLAARSLLDRKQYARAEEMLRRLVERTPSAEDRYLLAEALAGEQMPQKALQQLALVLEEADEPRRREALWLRASILIDQSHYEEAAATLQDVSRLTSDPETADACQAHLALCYTRAGRMDEARVAYAELTAGDTAAELLLPTIEQLADAAYAQGDYDWAADLFQRLADQGPSPDYAPKGLSGLAFCRLQSGQLPQAADLFARLVAEHPDHELAAAGAFARGTVLEKLERPDAALASYRTVVDDYPTCAHAPQALFEAARLHNTLAQPEEAAAAYRKIVERHAEWEQVDAALYRWAWLLSDTGRNEEALDLFRRLHGDFPQSRYWADATYRLAEDALALGRLDEADRWAAAVIESAPSDMLLGHALFLQSQIAAGRERYGEMEPPLVRITRDLPDHEARLAAEYWLAEAAYRDGRYVLAAERFAALVQHPRGRDAKWLAMAPLRQAQSLGQEKRWEDALRIAEKISADHPDFAQQYEADYLIGRCHAALGNFQQAREAYREVLRSPEAAKTETQAMAQWMIGETFFHQKDYHTALREYLRVEILYAFPTWQAAALLQAGKCHEHLGEWKEAAGLYSRLVNEYGGERFTDEAARRLREAKKHTAVPARS